MFYDFTMWLAESELAEKLVLKPVSFGKIWDKIYDLINGFLQAIPIIVLGLIVFLFFYLVGSIVRRSFKNLMRDRKHYNVALVLGRLAQWFFILLGLLITLAIIFPSITPADLLAGLGIGSIALALAFKDILQNYLSGILILIQEPFKIGDEIVYKNYEGQVEFIDTRTTYLKSYDGRRIIIPNGEIYTNTLMVNTTYGKRSTEYDITIGCNDDLQKASDVILSVLKNTEEVLDMPEPEVFIVDLSAYSNNIRARWWTKPQQLEVLRITSKILKNIKRELYAAGIDIPFPTEVVLWHDQTEDADGDRKKQREGWPADGSNVRSQKIAAMSTRKESQD